MTSVSVLAPEAEVKTGGSSGAPQAAQADRPRRPDHDHVAAQIVARLIELPRRAVVLAEDETHLNPLPHVRASWTLRTAARRSAPRHEPAGHRVRRDRGEHRALGVPAGGLATPALLKA